MLSDEPMLPSPTQRLRIAQVAPLWHSVPPQTYGGAERIVAWLSQQLIGCGHEVTLVASGDSGGFAKLQPTVPYAITRLMREARAENYHHYLAASLAWVLEHQHEFDIIHMHVEPHWIPIMSTAQCPVVFRLYTALSPDDRWVLERYPLVQAVGISHDQIQGLSSEARSRIPVIYNGCDFREEIYCPQHRGYLLFLGRMGAHKNPIGAIEIARKSRMPLILAGAPVNEQEHIYFEEEVKPLIDGKQIQYVGAVSGRQKQDLLAGAAALVFPIQWGEPFGIVMIEAMASGTPVLGCAHGSVPEVIDPGITGFFADSVEQLVPLVRRAIALPRDRVRACAGERFSVDRMAGDYVQLYHRLIDVVQKERGVSGN
jgi:glycosyltransferase involved in cell wall biosynthesis